MNSSEKKHPGEQEIDLLELANKLWQKKIFILKVCVIGMIAGVVIAFSIPKEYSTTVILAPEAKSTTSGNVGMLASMAGINLSPQTEDAISPELYPNIASSTPFLVGLFDVKVEDEKKGVSTDLFTYLEEEQSQAWWGYIFGLPSKIMGLFSSKNESEVRNRDLTEEGQIQLSRKQNQIIENLKNRINVSVDKKTGVISLSSMMQSPEISAFIADTVTSYLQKYIINYRTQKARNDLAFTEKL
ncbi:MAG TPA: chain-length determining protein, partial [Dysgonomonas sp.]|nr:chain-length determining protein [Dysgonomonas sp.]